MHALPARFTVSVRPGRTRCFTAPGWTLAPLNERGRVCAMRVDPEIAFIYDDTGDGT